jgi:hypothetical protein
MPVITLQGSVGSNGKNNPNDVIVVKTRLMALGFDWLLPDDTKAGPLTIHTIKLFQAIKNSHNTVEIAHNDGLIEPRGETKQWLEASNAPHWKRMSRGSKAEGYLNDEVVDDSDNHDFGTDWLEGVIKAVAADYRDGFLSAHPNAALLTVNDTSVPRGGNTPDHVGHEAGLACDLKLPRTDGEAGGVVVGASLYDRAAARAILLAFHRQKLFSRAFLNDNTLITEGLCQHLSGHDNHIHVEIKAPVRQP